MKKFTIVTDLHIGSAFEIKADVLFKDNPVLLGDNFDFKGQLKKYNTKNRILFEEILKLKLIHVASNHEGEWGLPQFHIDEESSTMFTHGHLCKSNSEKYIKDSHTHWTGTNLLTWTLKGMVNKLIHIIPFRKEDAIRASNLAKMNGCSNIILGHYHTSYDKSVNGVRVIVCPRGITEVIV